MEKLFTSICHFVGLRLLTLGSQLCGFRIVAVYSPEDRKDELHAVHLATSEAQLNSSMRSYVESLEATYEL
jgi:hypothetical protein